MLPPPPLQALRMRKNPRHWRPSRRSPWCEKALPLSLSDTKSSLGDAKSSLGDAKGSLGGRYELAG
jgi:hypothetical protein